MVPASDSKIQVSSVFLNNLDGSGSVHGLKGVEPRTERFRTGTDGSVLGSSSSLELNGKFSSVFDKKCC